MSSKIEVLAIVPSIYDTSPEQRFVSNNES